MDLALDDLEVSWTPGWDWLAVVAAIHVLAVVPWTTQLGLWPLLPGITSLGYYLLVFRRRERWRLALAGETVVVFEPRRGNQPPRQAKLRRPVWLTHSLLVVRTSRRILLLRAGRYDPVLFARLRRAFLSSGLSRGGLGDANG